MSSIWKGLNNKAVIKGSRGRRRRRKKNINCTCLMVI
jgi:hypothetical protein